MEHLKMYFCNNLYFLLICKFRCLMANSCVSTLFQAWWESGRMTAIMQQSCPLHALCILAMLAGWVSTLEATSVYLMQMIMHYRSILLSLVIYIYSLAHNCGVGLCGNVLQFYQISISCLNNMEQRSLARIEQDIGTRNNFNDISSE